MIKMRDLLNEIGTVKAKPVIKGGAKFLVQYMKNPNSSNSTYKTIEVVADGIGSYEEDGDHWVVFQDPYNPSKMRLAMFDSESQSWVIYN